MWRFSTRCWTRARTSTPGAVIGGGSPLADAAAFAQWEAAYRLVERGATTTLRTAATLGLMDRVTAYFTPATEPAQHEIDAAFWGACHGGHLPAAEFLAARGATIDWIPPWEPKTPLDAAERSNADNLARWLRERGARSAMDLAT